MCEKRRPNREAFLENLEKPLPTGKKVYLVLRNTALKIIRLRDCCDHPGEPGC